VTRVLGLDVSAAAVSTAARIQDALRVLGSVTRPWLVICHTNSVRDGGAETRARRDANALTTGHALQSWPARVS